MVKKIYLYFFYTIVSYFALQNTFSNTALAGQNNTITFSSGYFEKYYNNRQIANFGLEYINLFDYAFEKTVTSNFYKKQGPVTKLVLHTLLSTIDCFFIIGFDTAYHEFGHAMRFKALGQDYLFVKSSKNGYDATDDKKANNKNFFKYLFNVTFVEPFSGGATLPFLYINNETSAELINEFNSFQHQYNSGIKNPEEYLKNKGKTHLIPELKKFIKLIKEQASQNIITYTGGINNEVYFQEKMTERTYLNNRITISDYIFSIFSKSSIIAYIKTKDELNGSTGDPEAIETNFKFLGIKADRKKMEKSFLLSILLSQTTYAPFLNLSFKINTSFAPLQYKGFIFPDVFPYITTKGISYRIKSAYKYSDNLIFRFGIEFVAYGESAQEFIFGINTKLMWNTRLDFATVFGKYGVNIETTYTIPIIKHLNINLDFDLHSTKSLYGERNAYRLLKLSDPFKKKDEFGNEHQYYKTSKPLSYSYYFGASVSYLF